jgi:hypothetical protein
MSSKALTPLDASLIFRADASINVARTSNVQSSRRGEEVKSHMAKATKKKAAKKKATKRKTTRKKAAKKKATKRKTTRKKAAKKK